MLRKAGTGRLENDSKAGWLYYVDYKYSLQRVPVLLRQWNASGTTIAHRHAHEHIRIEYEMLASVIHFNAFFAIMYVCTYMYVYVYVCACVSGD